MALSQKVSLGYGQLRSWSAGMRDGGHLNGVFMCDNRSFQIVPSGAAWAAPLSVFMGNISQADAVWVICSTPVAGEPCSFACINEDVWNIPML